MADPKKGGMSKELAGAFGFTKRQSAKEAEPQNVEEATNEGAEEVVSESSKEVKAESAKELLAHKVKAPKQQSAEDAKSYPAKMTFYFGAGDLEGKLFELTVAYWRATGEKINQNEALRRILQKAAIEDLYE